MIIRSIQRDLYYTSNDNASNKNLTIKYNGSNSELSSGAHTKLNEKLKLEPSLATSKSLKTNSNSSSTCKLNINSVNNSKSVIHGSNNDISSSTSKNEVSILLVITDDNNSSSSDKANKKVGSLPSVNNSLASENRIGRDKEKQQATKRKKSKNYSKHKHSKRSSPFNYDRNLDRFNYFNLLCSKKATTFNNPDEYKLKIDDFDLQVKPYNENTSSTTQNQNHHHSRKRKKNKKYSKHRRSSSSSSAHCCNRRPKTNIDRFNYFNLLCSNRKKFLFDENKQEKEKKAVELEEEEASLILNKSRNRKSKCLSNLAIEICTDEDEPNSKDDDYFYFSENNISKPAKLKHNQSKKDILDIIYGSSQKMPGIFATPRFSDEESVYKRISNKYHDIIDMFSDSDSELELSLANNILNYDPYVMTNINFDDTISDKLLANLHKYNMYGPVRLIPSTYQRPPLPPIYNSKFWLRSPPIYQTESDLGSEKLTNQLEQSVSGVNNYLYGEHINKSYSSSPSLSLSSFSDSTNLDLNLNEATKANIKLSSTKINSSSNEQVESPYSTFNAIKNDKLFQKQKEEFYDEEEDDYISPIPIKLISTFGKTSSIYADEKNNIYKEIYATNDDSSSNYYSDEKLFKNNDKNEKTYESMSDLYYEQHRLDENEDVLLEKEKPDIELNANDLSLNLASLDKIFQKITRQNRVIFYETNSNNDEEPTKYEANLPCLPDIAPFPDNSLVKVTKLPTNNVKRGIGSVLKGLNQSSLINLSVIAEEDTQSPRNSKLFSSSSSSNNKSRESLEPKSHTDKEKGDILNTPIPTIIAESNANSKEILSNLSSKCYSKKVRSRKLNISNSTSSSSSSNESLDNFLSYRKSRVKNKSASSNKLKSAQSNVVNDNNNDTYDDATSNDEVVYI